MSPLPAADYSGGGGGKGTSVEALPDLQDGCRAQDRARIMAAAHRLKSPARSLGAAEFGGLLHELECRAAEFDWPPLTTMVGNLVQARTGLDEKLRAELAR